MIEAPLADGLVDLAPLDEFLRSDRAPATAMMMSQLDGFLSGIAIGPIRVLPSEWLPMIWGDEEPVFDSVEEMRAVLGVVMSRYNEILSTLRQDPPEFAPVFGKVATGEWTAAGWAEGFISAISLRQRAWMPLIKRLEGRILLLPILLSCCDEDELAELGLDPIDYGQLVGDAIHCIPEAVSSIDDFWGERRSEAKHRKTPRNARCPCGSGRKYKLCCGADQARRPQARKPSFLRPGLP